MTIQEMQTIIAQEELDKYNRFYFGKTYIGENCISMELLPGEQYRICVTGERGKHSVEILPESEACLQVIAYLRHGKRMWLKFGPRW